jgi:hypothetical protein
MADEEKVLFCARADMMLRILQEMRADATLNRILKGSVLESTRLVVTDRECGIFTQADGLGLKEQKEFNETVKPLVGRFGKPGQ